MDKAPSVIDAQKKENKLKLSEAEQEYTAKIRKDLTHMLYEREQIRPQFDDMTFSQYDDRCIRADMSYIPPARNKGETRIVTGMTREKDSTLLSTALSYNFEPNFTAFDQDDRMVDEIGEDMEDLVFKSRQMENYESKRPLIYRGIIARGTYYALELHVERYSYDKKLPDGHEMGKVSGVEWGERLTKVFDGLEITPLDPKKVFLSSMKEFFIQKQDAVAIVERISYEAAREQFGEWERWKYVPRNFSSVGANVSDPTSVWSPFWTLTETGENEVEKVTFMRKKTNEVQILLSGVPMLPVIDLGKDKHGECVVSGFPLTAISPSGDYPIVKGDFEPIEGFAISKGQPAKMRVDQDVMDEFQKLMIEKTKQSYKPTLVNNSGRVLSREAFLASNVLNDIPRDSVYPLLDTQGVTPGEFSFYQLLKTQMESKSTTAQYEGQETDKMTATQVLENKKQQSLKLGNALDAIVRFEHDFSLLRLKNILANWTKAQDKRVDEVRGVVTDIYRTFTIDKTRGKGNKSRKIVKFTQDVAEMKKLDPLGLAIYEKEAKTKKETGLDERYSFIDPKALLDLNATWYCTIVPNDKKDDTMARMLFVQNIREAIEMFGPQSINVAKLKQRYAAVIGEDYDTLFASESDIKELMAMAPKGEDMRVPKPTMKQALQA